MLNKRTSKNWIFRKKLKSSFRSSDDFVESTSVEKHSIFAEINYVSGKFHCTSNLSDDLCSELQSNNLFSSAFVFYGPAMKWPQAFNFASCPSVQSSDTRASVCFKLISSNVVICHCRSSRGRISWGEVGYILPEGLGRISGHTVERGRHDVCFWDCVEASWIATGTYIVTVSSTHFHAWLFVDF